MVIAVRAEEIDDMLVVVKEARSDGDVARLTREVAMLSQARHPGVVAVLDVSPRSVRLSHGGTALARLGPFALPMTAGIVAAVADIVSAIHRCGVTHGDLDANHVVLDASGTPRLCGFGQAQTLTDDGAAEDVAALGRLLASLLAVGAGVSSDLGRKAARQARRELDTLASQAQHDDRRRRPSARQFSKAIHAAVPHTELPEDARAPDRGQGFAAIPDDVGPTSDLGWTAADLSFLAVEGDATGEQPLFPNTTDPYAALTGENPAIPVVPPPAMPLDPHGPARPTITVAPGTEMGPSDGPTAVSLRERVSAPPATRRLPIGRIVAGVLVLAGGIIGGAVGVRALDPLDTLDDDAPIATSTTVPDPTQAADLPTTIAPTTEVLTTGPNGRRVPPTWPERCSVPDLAGPDVDDDGCPEAIEFLTDVPEDAAFSVQIGPVRIDLGEPGDLEALGDWTCDGIATPALLRPSTGEVFVFPVWTIDEPVEVEPITILTGATAIAATDDSCPLPLITTDSGRVVVDVER